MCSKARSTRHAPGQLQSSCIGYMRKKACMHVLTSLSLSARNAGSSDQPQPLSPKRWQSCQNSRRPVGLSCAYKSSTAYTPVPCVGFCPKLPVPHALMSMQQSADPAVKVSSARWLQLKVQVGQRATRATALCVPTTPNGVQGFARSTNPWSAGPTVVSTNHLHAPVRLCYQQMPLPLPADNTNPTFPATTLSTLGHLAWLAPLVKMLMAPH